ncbi:MAG: SPOR domain-containing protein [candidate division WOR-3 bacterium]
MLIEFCLFSIIIVNENKVLNVNIENLSFQEFILKEEVIDYIIDDQLYALTEKNIFAIDKAKLQIIDHTPLPQRFNYITNTKDEIIIISTSELIILNKKNLAFKNGIGIEPGDYQPMVSPVKLPRKELLYLFTKDDKRSIIKIIDLHKGRTIKSKNFTEIKNYYYLPQEKNFVILTSSGLHYLDTDLKVKKSIKFEFPGEDFFFYRDYCIITNSQAICKIDKNGKMIDFQPVLLNGTSKNADFVFYNKDFIVLIEPFTMRIKYLLENERKIYKMYGIDFDQNLCLSRDGAIFLMDYETGLFKALLKSEYAIKPPVIKETISGDSLFYIQFGAFSEINRAQNFCDSIKNSGLPVFIDSAPNNLYRIKFGGFLEKELAQELMEKSGISSWLVYNKKIEHVMDTKFIFQGQSYEIKNGIIKKE